MTIGWVDASVGVSGDMLLGALVDSGVPLQVMQHTIDELDLGITLQAHPVRRSGLGATKVDVAAAEPRTIRHLPDIVELLGRLDSPVRDRAVAVFHALGEAESRVHRVPIDEVHFHEVGALDCIADIVGVVAGLHWLGLDRLFGSPLGLGSGHAKTEHGLIPVPVPAVTELVRGVPAAGGPADFEATTPTGAALLVTLVDDWGPMPPMAVKRVGTGAGGRDHPRLANVTRLVLGRAATADGSRAPASTELFQIDANVDDLDPRLWPLVIDALIAAGAVVGEGQKIPANVLAAGVPARVKGELSEAVQARLREAPKAYVAYGRSYQTAAQIVEDERF